MRDTAERASISDETDHTDHNAVTRLHDARMTSKLRCGLDERLPVPVPQRKQTTMPYTLG